MTNGTDVRETRPNPLWATAPTIVVGVLSVFGVLLAATISYAGVAISSNRQLQAARGERLWTVRTEAYGDVIATAKKRQATIARVARLEVNPDVPGGRDERRQLLEQIRTDQVSLEAALTRASLLGGESVQESLNVLTEALDSVVASSEGFGAGVGCSGLQGLEPLPLFPTCFRYVDKSAPIDEQALAVPLIEDDELATLADALNKFVVTASRELSP